MRAPGCCGGREEALAREHVLPDVHRKDAAEAAHSGLAGEVEHPVDAREAELVRGDVDALHRETARVLLLQRRVVVVGERIPADRVVPPLEERAQELRADEPGGAGDDVAHRAER